MVYNNKEERDSITDFYFAIIYLTTLQIILAIIIIDNLKCETFDIIITFFNTIVSKDTNVFVKQPKDFKNSIKRIYKFYKVLYSFRKSFC